MLHLGLSGRILGSPRLATYDSQRAASRPHLSISLLYLRDVLLHLQRHSIRLYRLPAHFAPYLTQPHAPGFHNQIAECADDLRAVGSLAQANQLRLTLHLDSTVVLSTPDPELAARSRREIEAQAQLLSAFGLVDAVLVAHIGGAYGDRAAALARCVAAIGQLSATARALLAIEHDGRVWSLVDALHVHARSGVPIIFDHLHHQLYDPHQLGLATALEYALATWPAARRPKIHFSSPRTELRIGTTDAGRPHLSAPQWFEHSDYAHPFELIRLLRLPACRPYDVMLEAKAGDLALLRAREDVARFAPDLVDNVM
jgi:UV DNA damage endonuclease